MRVIWHQRRFLIKSKGPGNAKRAQVRTLRMVAEVQFSDPENAFSDPENGVFWVRKWTICNPGYRWRKVRGQHRLTRFPTSWGRSILWVKKCRFPPQNAGFGVKKWFPTIWENTPTYSWTTSTQEERAS